MSNPSTTSNITRKLNNIKNIFSNTNSANSVMYVKIVIIIIVILIIIGLIIYVTTIAKKDAKNCSRMASINENFPKLGSILDNDDNFKYNFRDYYIKTAYNACSAGKYKNDFVNICALKNVIKQGVRCLHFEIYSLDDKPVISTSTSDDFFTKETYNYVNFIDVIQTINSLAFSAGNCTNFNDPLILYFNIKSNNKKIYDIMANVLYNEVNRRLLDKNYSYENGGNNLGQIPLQELRGKIIIIVNGINRTYIDTKLDEYINATTGSEFFRKYDTNTIKTILDMNELINYNRKNMSIVLPNKDNKTKNNSPMLAMNYGCQMIGMIFQSDDENLKYYNNFFEEKNTAFVLKPENLRYIPVTIPIPKPPPKSLSYQDRKIVTKTATIII